MSQILVTPHESSNIKETTYEHRYENVEKKSQ